MEEFVIRVRKSQAVVVILVILEISAVVLFFAGLIFQMTEPVIQSILTIAGAMVLRYYNEGSLTINQRGVVIEEKGTFKWQDIELLNINKRYIVFKLVTEKAFKIGISPNEDKKKLSNAIKYVNSKIKNSSEEYDIELEKLKHKVI
jgi:hypothetical protein